ncbi:MAG: hypothetical protein J5982_04475 [Bacilli bacterium]|nr:hypothetical protein [Bacilli bacterium]
MSPTEEINNRFKVKIDESGLIINIGEFHKNLDATVMDDDIETYLITLNNRIKNSNFPNREELSHIIESKLLEYQAAKQDKMDNRESLRMMIEANEDLKKLGIITTKAIDNDSNKDIDYLTFTNESGVTEVLVCASSNTLNDYIKSNYDKISSMTAKEVFHHFKEYIHVDLRFVDPTKEEDYKLLNHGDEKFQDDEILSSEYEEVKKYSDKYSIGCKPEVTIDPNGERIYRLKDGLFKFRTTENKREMVILKTPSINLDDTNDLLAELDVDAQEYEVVDITPINTDKLALPVNYDEVPITSINEENINRVMELIQKSDVYGAELTSNELIEIDRMIKTLIESMVERVKGNTNSELDMLLSDYINKLIEKEENEELDENSENTLTDLEREFIEKYNSKMDYIKENNLDMRKNKKLELELPNKGSESGIATIVMLLEIMLLALFVLLFSHIDI